MGQEDISKKFLIEKLEGELTIDAYPFHFIYKATEWREHERLEPEKVWMISSIKWADGRHEPLPEHWQDYLKNPEPLIREDGAEDDFRAAVREQVLRWRKTEK